MGALHHNLHLSEAKTVTGNLRLQEMMGIMAEERGGKVFATDERYVPSSLSRYLYNSDTRGVAFALTMAS